jgi:tRNA 5-methylaminomethyl-2-thiouridine biosynthesis bifunctional protein
MKPNTPWRPAPAAAIDWSNDGTPRSKDFGDVYYSQEDGPAESRHVFLAGNDLPRRWLNHDRPVFTIAETGFGTGLNFLLTWQAWRAQAAPRARLHYLSIDKFPLAPPDLERAVAQWPELRGVGRQLLANYPGLLPGQHRLALDDGAVMLDLWWSEAREALTDLAGHQRPFVDAWYLDGFAPARNTAMWDDEVLHRVGPLSRPGATFATFTAAGAVRRGLQAAGFNVEKVPGFGRKRECLRGALRGGSPVQAPGDGLNWDLPADSPRVPDSALVIGAGLAGCTAAWSLATRGVAVTLVDQGAVASGASANDQGILYTRLSRKHAPLTDFALQSFQFAGSFYRQLFADGALEEDVDGRLCGCFQASDNSDEMAALSVPLADVEGLARVVDAEAANCLTGLQQLSAGYWLPGSGWMNPAAVCRALLQHANITLREQCGALQLAATTAGWRAEGAGGTLAEAACAVVAAGISSTGISGLDWLPLQAIRGQTTSLPRNDNTADLRAAFCHDGYIAPARTGYHCIGATFDLNDEEREPRGSDNRKNLAKLAQAVPAWAGELAAIDADQLGARVGFRCASPDYLPLVGPVPDRDALLQDFAALRQNARQPIDSKGRYMKGLYLSTGHGSRGLTSTPLAGELLASAICDEAPPLERALRRALAPARFLIRDLGRNRI